MKIYINLILILFCLWSILTLLMPIIQNDIFLVEFAIDSNFDLHFIF